ncbi:hypothetical protein K501DRAFT_322850 [Backusella circina FSU 941]|nr:hypothetical protein K501DRAFT_322850 [Backusella circina FSU 941]
MSGYGAVPLSQEEAAQTNNNISWRTSLGEKLESQRFHIAVLGLILLDSLCVGIQIIYTFFHECQVPLSHSRHWMLVAFEMAEVISMFICCLFLIECKNSYPVIVIITTFVLEVVLRGKEREVAGLLIIFRFWRIVKVIEAVVMGVSFSHEEELESIKEQCERLEAQLAAEKEKNAELVKQLESK